MVDSSSTRPEPEAAGRPESTHLPAGGAPLVVRFGAFGDMIMLVPQLRALCRRHGRPVDVISSGLWVEPLLQSLACVGTIRLINSRRTPFWLNPSQWRLVAWLRTRAAGPVYVCEHDAKTYRLLGLGRVAKEWICPLPALPRRPEEHVVEHLLRFARQTPAALGGETLAHLTGPPPDHRLEPTAAAREDCAAWLAALGLGRAGEPMVLIHPGNKKTMRRGDPRRARNIKYWPAENWAAVIRGVRSALPASRVLVSGTARERPLAASIVQACADPQVVNLAGQLSIPRLLALQVRAHSMISVDTGPSHAATAVGCPVVVLIVGNALASCGPRPTSAPAQVVVSPVSPATGDSAPLTAITPQEVLAAWRRLPGVPGGEN
jgi:heptosyltransferase-2/heptosyltransferase-3